MLYWMIRNLMCFASDDGAGAGGSDADAGDNAGKGDTGSTGGGEKTFTQAELDKVVSDRLAREAKKLRADIQAELKAEADKAAMTEAERLKAEKDAAAKSAADATTKANARVIRAEAKVLAVAAGVKPERIDYALRLADLSGVEVNDDGNPDSDAITKALNQVLTDVPELKGETPGKGGAEGFDGGKGGTVTEAQVKEWLTNPKEREKHWAEITAFYSNKK